MPSSAQPGECPPALEAVYRPIGGDLRQVCRIFDDELFSEVPAINDLCDQVRRYRGKMLRPALLLFSARACGGVTEEHLTLAAVIEMVHMATLVHDDVLDEADMRRRHATINRLHGNEAAVLLGDYLISHAFHLCSSLPDTFASRQIGQATNTVCEGELQQVYHRGDLDLGLEQYLEIIARKTAALTETACLLGAHFAGAGQATVAALTRYGRHVGIAFQITDDVLDIVGREERTGKTLGRDLAEGKLTLPIIHALTTAAPDQRQRLRQLITATPYDREGLARLLGLAGSLEYALSAAREYVASAVAALEALPVTEARECLSQMAAMIVTRQA